MPKTIHQGRNVKRFREMLGIKQEALAFELGEDWNQRKILVLEQKEDIEPELLDQLARVLKVPAEAIRNFDEETAMFNIQHNYEGSSVNSSPVNSHSINPTMHTHCTFNPIDKVVELYERLLEAEKEKAELYQKLYQEK
ncbi:helix-turn-helix domain-containing protein [Larkinella soli]|uniref:helix-turn-helix domain-containing protein n=1 Tax=Larkinella soli TaxID=1770527 RepID=UPI000FFCC0AE|nr:helix-turn-helix domain-containing protein [Larkinella soli]